MKARQTDRDPLTSIILVSKWAGKGRGNATDANAQARSVRGNLGEAYLCPAVGDEYNDDDADGDADVDDDAGDDDADSDDDDDGDDDDNS